MVENVVAKFAVTAPHLPVIPKEKHPRHHRDDNREGDEGEDEGQNFHQLKVFDVDFLHVLQFTFVSTPC